jgi:hypothetical protein
MTNTISTYVHHTVTLGTGNYGSSLIITETGTVVAGGVLGGLGVTSVVTNASVTNAGSIFGGGGAVFAGNGALPDAAGVQAQPLSGEAGGYAVSLEADSKVVNEATGMIAGGHGGSGLGSVDGFSGGGGVDLAVGSSLVNRGTILGGDGGFGRLENGSGGSGVSMLSAGVTLNNSGSITGGAAGGSNETQSFVTGGVGVYFAGATLKNSGSIAGGAGGTVSSGAVGLELNGGAIASNAAAGKITGGAAGRAGTNAGTGVVLKTASLSNAGTIIGGVGGSGSTDALAGGVGGIGVNLSHGAALDVMSTGTVAGGVGGGSKYGGGGMGGAGVQLTGGATLTNAGTLKGGAGGPSKFTGSATHPGGDGGAGVYIDGGTLTTSGTVAGGAGGTAIKGSRGVAGAAVAFGPVAGTLVVDPGAVFDGQVTANTAVKDVLELQGKQTAKGTSITLGTQFTGFSTLDFASRAQWTVDATTAALSSHAPTIKGFALGEKIDVTNLAHGATASFNTTTEVLTVKDGTSSFKLQFDSAFKGDTFQLTAAGAGTDISLKAAAAALDASTVALIAAMASFDATQGGALFNAPDRVHAVAAAGMLAAERWDTTSRARP